MFTSFFLMRCSSRSSGPSKLLEADRQRVERRFEVAGAGPSQCVTQYADLHRVAHALHRLARRRRARALRAFEENLLQTVGLRQHGRAPLADRIEVRVERGRQLGLHLDVADLAGAVARLQVVDFGRVRVERVVVGEDRIALDRARDVGADPLRDRCTSASPSSSPRRRVSDRWIVLPRLLLIFLSPSSPGRRPNVVSSGCGSTRTSPKKLLKRRTTSRDSSRCAT